MRDCTTPAVSYNFMISTLRFGEYLQRDVGCRPLVSPPRADDAGTMGSYRQSRSLAYTPHQVNRAVRVGVVHDLVHEQSFRLGR
jgi:hypothetical protein